MIDESLLLQTIIEDVSRLRKALPVLLATKRCAGNEIWAVRLICRIFFAIKKRMKDNMGRFHYW